MFYYFSCPLPLIMFRLCWFKWKFWILETISDIYNHKYNEISPVIMEMLKRLLTHIGPPALITHLCVVNQFHQKVEYLNLILYSTSIIESNPTHPSGILITTCDISSWLDCSFVISFLAPSLSGLSMRRIVRTDADEIFPQNRCSVHNN